MKRITSLVMNRTQFENILYNEFGSVEFAYDAEEGCCFYDHSTDEYLDNQKIFLGLKPLLNSFSTESNPIFIDHITSIHIVYHIENETEIWISYEECNPEK